MNNTSESKPAIDLIKDGPLKVTGLGAIRNSRGDRITVKRVFSLCRCGASRKKPFCDGTHKAIGWSDEQGPDRVPDKLEEYSRKDLSILDNRGTCSHAGFCTSGLPRVFRQGVEPWIDPEGAGSDEIKTTIRKCPSGALAYKEGGRVETEFFDGADIVVSRDGPFWVRGGIELTNVAKGEGASVEHYALCRCGKSRNKPFCDGTHWYAGFKDDEALTISRAQREGASGNEEWIEAGRIEGFEVGQVYPITAGDKTIALVRTESGWHAVDGLCPHQGGPLTEGTLCDGAVRCPWHGYDFSLESGKGLGNEFEVETYEVQERDGKVWLPAPAPSHSPWTVSHVVVETLVEWGLDTVFGMVGHSNLGLSEAVRIQEQKGKLRYFGIRHEGAAAFACSGYAKLTGRPAACLAIAGPGATNLLTGLWDAKVDRAPVVALTGQVNTQVMGPGAFQDIDLSAAFEAVANFSQTVLPGSNHAELASLAMKTALVDRNVSHLIFPDEVQILDAGEAGPARPDGRLGETTITPPSQPLDHSLYRLGRARRPVIIVGYGARKDMRDVLALAERLHAPVITTFKGKGQLPDEHPLSAGVLGRSGTPVASWFMNESDLLLVFGASFAQHTGIATSKPIIQVDFDRMALGKFHRVDEAVWGDIGVTARRLLEGLPGTGDWTDQREELERRRQAWRDEKAARRKQDRSSGINSATIFDALSDAVPEDAVIAVDVGNNTYSFGRYFESKRQPILMSGYLGSIGFAFPAAMGAWAAAPDRKIVSISGDGGFGQYMTEFQTAVKYGMNITHVLLNNSELGKISKEQRDGEWPVWQTQLHNVNFADYAKLCGGMGTRVESAGDLKAALNQALSSEGPSLVEIMSDPMLT